MMRTKGNPARRKATPAKPVSVCETIVSEQGRWAERRVKVEADLGAARDRVAEVKRQRDGLLLRALDEPAAQVELAMRRTELAAAEAMADELAATLDQIGHRQADLERELAVAQREEAMAELRGFARERMTIAEEIDRALAPLPELLGRWRTAAGKCSELAPKAGLDGGGHPLFQPARIGNAIAWALAVLFPHGVQPASSGGVSGQLRDTVSAVERQQLARILGPVPVPTTKQEEKPTVPLFPSFGMRRIVKKSDRRLFVHVGDDEHEMIADAGGGWVFLGRVRLAG